MIWTNNTTPTSLPPSTTDITDGHDWGFQYISPLNITLAAYIMNLNSMIIYDYHKDWRRISSLFFIVIAAVDIGNACSEIGRGSISLLCMKDPSMRLHPWTFLVWLLFGTLSYVTSTYLVLALTVVKTINIMRPFYSQNIRALKIFLIMYPSILLVLYISDVWFYTNFITKYYYNDSPKCGVRTGPWTAMSNIDTIGQSTAYLIIMERYFPSHKVAAELIINIVGIFLSLVQFGMPCLIVLVCMVLQMIYIKKALRGNENPLLNTANQVNLTVFLISLLYLSSVSLYFILITREHYFNFHFALPIIILVKFTLPLINAALFPTILILRKPELRARYRNYIAKVLLLPLTIYGKVRYLAQRRRGYSEI